MMRRVVQSELLDHLAPEDPKAQASRRDLRRIHRLMGHGRRFQRIYSAVARRSTGSLRIVDLGAGDGAFLARVLPQARPGSTVLLVDRVHAVDAAVEQAYADRGWQLEVIEADIFEALQGSELACDLMLANLFLHHFEEGPLRQLLSRAAQLSTCFVALEPRRNRWALAAATCLPLLGCNRITRHDSKVSVRAGFNGQELSRLWPRPEGWQLFERPLGLFSHAFTASFYG